LRKEKYKFFPNPAKSRVDKIVDNVDKIVVYFLNQNGIQQKTVSEELFPVKLPLWKKVCYVNKKIHIQKLRFSPIECG